VLKLIRDCSGFAFLLQVIGLTNSWQLSQAIRSYIQTNRNLSKAFFRALGQQHESALSFELFMKFAEFFHLWMSKVMYLALKVI